MIRIETMFKCKSLKDLIPSNKKLVDEAKQLLKEPNLEVFKNNYQKVVNDILGYRDKYICEHASKILEQGIPMDVYYSDDENIDELGILVIKIMDKRIRGT